MRGGNIVGFRSGIVLVRQRLIAVRTAHSVWRANPRNRPRLAMQESRFVIDEIAPNAGYNGHRLKDLAPDAISKRPALLLNSLGKSGIKCQDGAGCSEGREPTHQSIVVKSW